VPTDLTPGERTLRARLASYESWAHTPDRSARTAPARAAHQEGIRARLRAEIDPSGKLSERVLEEMVDAGVKAHYTRLALLSARARRQRGGRHEMAP
jgi:hypothetical protein